MRRYPDSAVERAMKAQGGRQTAPRCPCGSANVLPMSSAPRVRIVVARLRGLISGGERAEQEFAWPHLVAAHQQCFDEVLAGA